MSYPKMKVFDLKVGDKICRDETVYSEDPNRTYSTEPKKVRYKVTQISKHIFEGETLDPFAVRRKVWFRKADYIIGEVRRV